MPSPKRWSPSPKGDDPDVVLETHDHWAVGHVDGFSIRVYRNGEITEAFKTYHDLMEQMDGYPILDEEDYSNREYEATLENISDAAWRVKHEYDLPEGWESEVFSWFWDHRQSAVENRDDQGGYPEEGDLGQRSTPWDMSGSRTDLADTTGVGVKNTHPNGANL